MRYAIDVAPLGDLADPAVIVQLASAAELAGWDGLSIWDSLGVSMGTAAADPFVALSAVAAATQRLRLIASVIVLSRRRPQLVAQATATLDRLSGGRMVLGIGAGADASDFTVFGESFDSKRIARMDEAARLVDRFLRGVGEPPVGPRPVQQPRPPIWLGGMKPGALRRAAVWDGWIAVATSEDGSAMDLPPAVFGSMVTRLRGERAALERPDAPFDVAVFGFCDPSEADVPASFAAAGATWWLESLSPMRDPVDRLLERVEAGPPRV